MKALQVTQPHTFQQVEVPVPSLAVDGIERILVQPTWVSMCGSDVPFFTSNKRHKTYPLPVGAPIHECVGHVVESSSPRFKPFNRVIAIPEGDQGLAEFFVAKAEKAVQLPADLDDNGTSCLIQPLSTVINAVDRLGSVAGKSVAVVGLGSIGQFFCWLLKKRGAERVVGIDPLEQRCQTAKILGATDTLNGRSIEILHPNILFDKRQPEQWHKVEQMVAEEFEASLALGGTLSGEHGVGVLKRPYLEKALGPISVEIQRSIKRALDPLNILNPGKMFVE